MTNSIVIEPRVCVSATTEAICDMSHLIKAMIELQPQFMLNTVSCESMNSVAILLAKVIGQLSVLNAVYALPHPILEMVQAFMDDERQRLELEFNLLTAPTTPTVPH